MIFQNQVLIEKDSYVFQISQDGVRVNMIIKKLTSLVIKLKKSVKAKSMHFMSVCICISIEIKSLWRNRLLDNEVQSSLQNSVHIFTLKHTKNS